MCQYAHLGGAEVEPWIELMNHGTELLDGLQTDLVRPRDAEVNAVDEGRDPRQVEEDGRC